MTEKAPKDVDVMLTELEHRMHLKRERALTSLLELMGKNATPELWGKLCGHILKLTKKSEWEARHGGFSTAAKVIVPHQGGGDVFQQAILQECLDNLSFPEVRVRQAVADCLGALTSVAGLSIYKAVKSQVMEVIQGSFERMCKEEEPGASLPETMSSNPYVRPTGERDASGAMVLVGGRPSSPSLVTTKHTTLLHDTEGWKNLETAFRALQRMMEGCGNAFAPEITPELLDLIHRAVQHTNRYVRETGYFALASACRACGDDEMLAPLADRMVKSIACGLADNWSQVRFAGSVSARAFVETASSALLARFHASLLPPMCLNRYYVAQGVKLYSQETWRAAVGEKGREWVGQYIVETTEYYISQSHANNHAVREAACHCIAELAIKIDPETVAPHAEALIDALCMCFRDESWPVRDAASVATGRFVRGHPKGVLSRLDELYKLWFLHLHDNIWSVRENSAIALGHVMHAYGEEGIARVEKQLKKDLVAVKDQPADSQQFCSTTTAPTVFGSGVPLVKATRENDVLLHSDQQMYSCGSLGPKGKNLGYSTNLKRGTADEDHSFSRAVQPWECTDGAIYLLRELAAVNKEKAVAYLPTLIEVASMRAPFTHFYKLQETIWRQVPQIAKNLGKRMFKRHMDELLVPLFESLDSENRLVSAAAGDCLQFIETFVGRGILRGHLTPEMKMRMQGGIRGMPIDSAMGNPSMGEAAPWAARPIPRV